MSISYRNYTQIHDIFLRKALLEKKLQRKNTNSWTSIIKKKYVEKEHFSCEQAELTKLKILRKLISQKNTIIKIKKINFNEEH